MTLAARTREAVRSQPFMHDALRAGVVNYSAAARYLDVDGDPEATATALRRYAESLEDPGPVSREDAPEEGKSTVTSVTMHRGAELAEATPEALLSVGDVGVMPGDGAVTVVLAVGSVDVEALERLLGRLRVAAVALEAAGVADGSLAIVVPDREAATALRLVEDTLE